MQLVFNLKQPPAKLAEVNKEHKCKGVGRFPGCALDLNKQFKDVQSTFWWYRWLDCCWIWKDQKVRVLWAVLFQPRCRSRCSMHLGLLRMVLILFSLVLRDWQVYIKKKTESFSLQTKASAKHSWRLDRYDVLVVVFTQPNFFRV